MNARSFGVCCSHIFPMLNSVCVMCVCPERRCCNVRVWHSDRDRERDTGNTCVTVVSFYCSELMSHVTTMFRRAIKNTELARWMERCPGSHTGISSVCDPADIYKAQQKQLGRTRISSKKCEFQYHVIYKCKKRYWSLLTKYVKSVFQNFWGLFSDTYSSRT